MAKTKKLEISSYKIKGLNSDLKAITKDRFFKSFPHQRLDDIFDFSNVSAIITNNFSGQSGRIETDLYSTKSLKKYENVKLVINYFKKTVNNYLDLEIKIEPKTI